MDGHGIGDFSMLGDLAQFGANPPNPTGDTLFDASQYEFFGGNSVEEVELGGLEDEEEGHAPVGFEEEIQSDKEEGNVLGSLSEIEDLSSTFLKLNKVAGGPTSAGFSRDRGSRESSSASELAQDPAFNNWLDQRAYDSESQKWPSHPYSSSSTLFMEPNSLHRTSSYPEQHPQQPQILRHQHSSEPILSPNSPFTSYPPPGGRSQQGSLNDLSNVIYRQQIQRPDLSSFPHSHLSQFGGNLPQLPHHVNQNILYPGNHSGFSNNFPPQQNGLGLLPSQMMPPHHTRMRHPFQSPISHLQSQLLHQHLSPSSPNLNMLGFQDLRDQRLRARHPMTHYPNQSRQRFRSKYMSPDELENIHRMQLAATHSNDPYVEDYHHQAILARKSASARLRHHFSPTNLRDGSPKPNSTNEPHAFLQVDALGRVSFSSIRRPRPLLEVEPPNQSNNSESKFPEKSLEQEPMLAARVAIEDGIYLLLDVDDIDRYLQFNQLPDGGAQLRQRRQVLLEGLASSLQLFDPLGKNGETASLLPRDDFVFLRLVSLPKGKKLLSRYLELLSQGELARVVCMGICRNLRFLFGIMSENHESVTVTGKLAKTVSSCVIRMDLKSLSACLVSVVCGTENPPLRPIGHVSGDGASVILKSVLERATEVLRASNEGDNCSEHNRGFWQTSFDAFFGLLTKYCFNKYDSVLQSFISQGLSEMADVGPDVAKAISREMPVELLRASLPHTSEQQRKLLLEFAQRSMPVTGFGGSS